MLDIGSYLKIIMIFLEKNNVHGIMVVTMQSKSIKSMKNFLSSSFGG